jgi:hypothetical protein
MFALTIRLVCEARYASQSPESGADVFRQEEHLGTPVVGRRPREFIQVPNLIKEKRGEDMTNPEQEVTSATPGHTSSSPTQRTSPWRTAQERAAGLLAKKKHRRAAHRVALRRPHANG